MVATLEASSPITSRQHLFGCHLHPAEREQLLSQVFEGGAEVIDGVVDDEEAVVVAVALPNRDRRILPVVAFEVELQRFRDVFRDNLRRHALLPFRQRQQHRVVHIVVDENDAFACRPDQIRREGVCVEDLSVVEDTLDRWQGGAHEKINLVLKRVDLFGVFLKLSVDPLFRLQETLVDGVPS